MQFGKELNVLFESDTIKPTFTRAHVFLSLLVFDANPKGIGRYRLKEELLIGSGTARSLIEKLKNKVRFIEVMRDEGSKSSRRSGHVLTKNGKLFLNEFKQKIPLLSLGDLGILKEIIIESEKNVATICLVKDASDKMKYGVEQRDAAIMASGSGATCLQFDGEDLNFPLASSGRNIDEKDSVNKETLKYLKNLISREDGKLEKGDVIIIGLGSNNKISRLASLNAALTLI
jgi:hypothetical protein